MHFVTFWTLSLPNSQNFRYLWEIFGSLRRSSSDLQSFIVGHLWNTSESSSFFWNLRCYLQTTFLARVSIFVLECVSDCWTCLQIITIQSCVRMINSDDHPYSFKSNFHCPDINFFCFIELCVWGFIRWEFNVWR